MKDKKICPFQSTSIVTACRKDCMFYQDIGTIKRCSINEAMMAITARWYAEEGAH